MTEAMQIGWAEHAGFLLLSLTVAFLLGLLLGYILWHSYKKMVAELQTERDQWHNKYIELEKDHASLKYQYEELKKENGVLTRSLNNCEADRAILQNKLDAATADDKSSKSGGSKSSGKAASKMTTAAAAAATVYGTLFKEDNLQILEGIGPKIEKVLHKAGIRSWAQLAKKNSEELRAILDSAGDNFKINNPASWPKQAAYASTGQWDELIKYQKFLDGGRENTGDVANPSKLEKLAKRKKA